MSQRNGRIRLGVTLILVILIIAGPMIYASYISIGSAYAYEQFGTIPPEDRDFDAIFTATPDILTPIPTIGPGSTFEQGDTNNPGIRFIEKGDTVFGYGPLNGSDELYALWTTDKDGTHYVVVDKDSILLRGGIDLATNSRYENGFDDLIKQREEKKNLLDQEVAKIDPQDNTANSIFNIGAAAATVGAVVCILATFGVCAPIVGIGAALMVGGFASQAVAREYRASAGVLAHSVESIEGQLVERINRRTESEIVAPQGGG